MAAKEPSPIEFAVGDVVDRADIPGLCERARACLGATNGSRLACDVGGISKPDAVTIDALARIQLTARRLGRQATLRRASVELRDLIRFMGLRDVLILSGSSRLQVRREAEHRKQTGSVEKERDPADPAA